MTPSQKKNTHVSLSSLLTKMRSVRTVVRLCQATLLNVYTWWTGTQAFQLHTHTRHTRTLQSWHTLDNFWNHHDLGAQESGSACRFFRLTSVTTFTSLHTCSFQKASLGTGRASSGSRRRLLESDGVGGTTHSRRLTKRLLLDSSGLINSSIAGVLKRDLLIFKLHGKL